ncbi:hypothetical protein ALC62_03891 [Cyphomyrmex costatus]|uniref:THAP-type domain-containing protein n=1 Tax=Cyphomyrmex costatus TaxID=456900 RepID=A0A151IKU6_9HYME|nr:hypothetical protein ALC62_03891 [Cyphomyrmex costatus]
MSPTISILSALLLSLILGSTEGGQRMEPVSLLRQTLRYWRKIYKTYIDEVTLGYCWVNYLLEISNEWSTNLSTLTLAAMEVRADITSARAAQFNKIHPREKRWSLATAKLAIPKRRAVSMPELLHNERDETPRDAHKFSSRGTGSHVVNPTPNPRDNDKVDSGSTDLGEEDSRRKVLRSLTSRRDSFVGGDAFASRSFSLEAVREGSPGDQRFPFRPCSPSRKRNLRVVGTLSDPWMQKDHRIEGDPAGRRGSLNNDGSLSAPSRSQFRRVNADTKRSRVSVVKSMDSERNSSCDLTINSKMPRRKPEELSRDLLSSSREESAIAERSLFEFRGSGGDALKRNKKRHCQQPRKVESSRNGKNVSTIHPFFLSEHRKSYQQTPYENHGFSPVPTAAKWMKVCGKEVKLKSGRICSIHYLPTCYKKKLEYYGDYSPTTVRSLLPDALPTENIKKNLFVSKAREF